MDYLDGLPVSNLDDDFNLGHHRVPARRGFAFFVFPNRPWSHWKIPIVCHSGSAHSLQTRTKAGPTATSVSPCLELQSTHLPAGDAAPLAGLGAGSGDATTVAGRGLGDVGILIRFATTASLAGVPEGQRCVPQCLEESKHRGWTVLVAHVSLSASPPGPRLLPSLPPRVPRDRGHFLFLSAQDEAQKSSGPGTDRTPQEKTRRRAREEQRERGASALCGGDGGIFRNIDEHVPLGDA